jgi:hypothetical protein
MDSMFRLWLAAPIVVFLVQNAPAHYYPFSQEREWHGTGSKHSPTEAAIAQERWQELSHSLTPSGNSWLGEYVSGEGLSGTSRFRWSADKGFVVLWEDDSAIVSDVNYGTIIVEGRSLALSPHVKVRNEESNAFGMRMMFVRWGERRYLIPAEKLSKFCEYTSGVSQSSDDEEAGNYLLHRDDTRKPATGIPKFIDESVACDSKPISAVVRRVVRSFRKQGSQHATWDREVTVVELDKGSDHGVAIGMIFQVINTQRIIYARVTSVKLKTSVAEISQPAPRPGVDYGFDPSEYPPLRIHRGLRVTTAPAELN